MAGVKLHEHESDADSIQGMGALKVRRTRNKKGIKLYWPHGDAYQNDWLYL